MTAFGAFVRRSSTSSLLKEMVLENLALDMQLRREGLLPQLEFDGVEAIAELRAGVNQCLDESCESDILGNKV